MLEVRAMTLGETQGVVDYFLNATPEFLDGLGVDPTRLPPAAQWAQSFERQFQLPLERRALHALIWLDGGAPVGFSTADKITFGESAFMHLHVTDPLRRRSGLGASFVAMSANAYFADLRLKILHCEPNAFNVAPNRTLQKAGFKFIKTHMTVPGPLNYRQAVNRWTLER